MTIYNLVFSQIILAQSNFEKHNSNSVYLTPTNTRTNLHPFTSVFFLYLRFEKFIFLSKMFLID